MFTKKYKKASFILVIALMSCVEEGDYTPDVLDNWILLTTADGLVSDEIRSLYEDDEGNIYIGTSQGLSVFDRSGFTNYTTADGLDNNLILATVRDNDGDVWAGTPDGVNYLQGGVWKRLNYFYGAYVPTIIELSNNDVLVGTVGYGVHIYSYSQGVFDVFYYDSNCSGCNVINTLYEDSGGNVWIGTDAGLVLVSDGVEYPLDSSYGLSGDVITSFVEDNFGNLFVGTYDGRTITKIGAGGIEEVNLAISYTNNWVWDLELDDKGVLWISTAFSGLFRYDGAFMRKDFENLPDEYVSSLHRDSRGNLWIGTLFDGLMIHTPTR